MEFQAVVIPTPVGGLNRLDAVDSMPEQDLIEANNIYCDNTNVYTRYGQSLFGTSALSGTGLNLIEFTGANGVQSLFHHENGDVLVDMTTGTAVNVTLPNALNANMNWFGFNDRLFLFDGTNDPATYNPNTGTAAATGFTGVTGGNNTLIGAGSFKNTLCCIQAGTATMWYGALAAITGGLSSFNFAPFFKKGGFLRYVGSWTNQTANTSAELFIAISSEGDILCYNGDAPNTSLSNFSLVAYYAIGRPLGYKSFVRLENDLWVITEEGIVSIAALFQGGIQAAELIPSKINPIIQKYAQNIGLSNRWLGKSFASGKRIYISVPISTSSNILLVCNARTGAWSQYSYVEGGKVSSLANFNGRIYGVNRTGRICELETPTDDDGLPIAWSMKWAWNFLNSRNRFKTIKDVRPIIYCFSGQTLNIGVASDFQNNAEVSTIVAGVPQGASTDCTWDISDWDADNWAEEEQFFANWHAVSGQGFAASLQMSGTTNASIVINSIDLRFEIGSQR